MTENEKKSSKFPFGLTAGVFASSFILLTTLEFIDKSIYGSYRERPVLLIVIMVCFLSLGVLMAHYNNKLINNRKWYVQLLFVAGFSVLYTFIISGIIHLWYCVEHSSFPTNGKEWLDVISILLEMTKASYILSVVYLGIFGACYLGLMQKVGRVFTINMDEILTWFGLGVEDDEEDELWEMLEESNERYELLKKAYQEKQEQDFVNGYQARTEYTDDTKPARAYEGDGEYVFVSYSHKDRAAVFPIIKEIQRCGYNVWYDEGIDPGVEWDQSIASHVKKASVMLAFISGNYLESDNCKDELNYARDTNVDRVLIYLEEVELPDGMKMRLSRQQAIFYYTYPDKKDFYTKLMNASVMVDLKGKNE